MDFIDSFQSEQGRAAVRLVGRRCRRWPETLPRRCHGQGTRVITLHGPRIAATSYPAGGAGPTGGVRDEGKRAAA